LKIIIPTIGSICMGDERTLVRCHVWLLFHALCEATN
jgi:hypothetical protein